jgi:hypothetical protein
VNWLTAVITAVLNVLVAAIGKRSQPTCQDAKSDRSLREKLRAKVRKYWCIIPLMMMVLSLTGCGSRTIYVPDGTPVRLRETVPKVKVWVPDESGQPTAGVMDLPEGWYCLPADTRE